MTSYCQSKSCHLHRTPCWQSRIYPKPFIFPPQVLTGDNLPVARRVCQQLGIPVAHTCTGAQLSGATKEEVAILVRECTLFAKLNPRQKLQIVDALHVQDHVVGFLGDGTNDALALRGADVGISVDSGELLGFKRCLGSKVYKGFRVLG